MIRNAKRADLDWMVDWAAREGWNPGLDDAEAFYRTDPDGFFVYETGGQAVACISVVNHSPDYAFLGFYICDPDWRGRGIGLRLWQAAIAHAGGRTVALDGVADQRGNYTRSGFVFAGATTRMCGEVPASALAADCRSVGPGDTATLCALDAAATGVARTAFLTTWTTDTASRRTVVSAEAGGFATARVCRDGVKIGPVVAPDGATGVGLLVAAARCFEAAPVFVDLPDGQPEVRCALENWGFAPVFATARMYLGPAPAVADSQRAVATLELG